MYNPKTTRGGDELLARLQAQSLNRRSALSLLAGLGLAAGAARPIAAARLAQESATPADPAPEMGPPATPVLGEQPDGTVTWRVQVSHMDMENGIEAMGFYPQEITINAGDRIFYDVHGLHTISFPGAEGPPPMIVQEAAALGTPAAAGSASRWVINPAVAFPSGPPVHDGASYLNSGLPDPTVPPFVAEFTAAGTFEYLCLVHPASMKATVVVQEQGAERPHDQAAYDQQAAEQIDAVLAQGQALIEQQSGAAAEGTVWDVAAGVGEEQAQVMRFLPDRLEIHAGDTVRWTNLGGPEPHTVTFPGDTAPPELLLVEPQTAGPPLLVLNPEVMDPAGGPSYDGAGYVNSGWLQDEEVEFPEGTEFPDTWELTFDTPGEYPYYCVLHGGAGGEGEPALVGMVGTIVVS
jgi:plastocyanin